MKEAFRGSLARLLCVVLMSVSMAALTGCQEKDSDDEAATASSPAASQNAAITLNATDASDNGIITEPLLPAGDAPGPSLSSYGTVVDVSDLAAVRGQLETARAQRKGAAARLATSAAELERVALLYADDRNFSARAVEDARGAADADRAAVESANATIAAAEASLGQRWGTTIRRAFVSGAAWSSDLIARRAALVEVTLPPATPPPPAITLRRDDGGLVRARFLAESPRIDARLQRPASFYLAYGSGLPTGLTLPLLLPATSVRTGSFVPLRAVVWHDGAAFVFVEQPAGKYTPRPIDPSHPVADGYRASTLAPGTHVVTRGAAQLLSERNKSAITEED